MACFKAFFFALIALLNVAIAYDVPVKTSALVTTTTNDPGALTTFPAVSCHTVPGSNNSAIVYGTTFSIPVNLENCSKDDAAYTEAGARCGALPAPATSISPAETATSFIATIPPTDFAESAQSATRSITTATAAATATATGKADNATVDRIAFFVLIGLVVGVHASGL